MTPSPSGSVAACADYDVDDKNGRVVRGDHQVKQWAEDWTFQRSSKAVTKEGGTSARAHNAPTAVHPWTSTWPGRAATARLSSCRGEYDWVLARISQVG